MPKCTANRLELGRQRRRRIEWIVEGGALNSHGGLMPLQQVDRRIGYRRQMIALVRQALTGCHGADDKTVSMVRHSPALRTLQTAEAQTKGARVFCTALSVLTPAAVFALSA